MPPYPRDESEDPSAPEPTPRPTSVRSEVPWVHLPISPRNMSSCGGGLQPPSRPAGLSPDLHRLQGRRLLCFLPAWRGDFPPASRKQCLITLLSSGGGSTHTHTSKQPWVQVPPQPLRSCVTPGGATQGRYTLFSSVIIEEVLRPHHSF